MQMVAAENSSYVTLENLFFSLFKYRICSLWISEFN